MPLSFLHFMGEKTMMEKKNFWKKGAVVLFWLAVWQILAAVMKNSIVFVGPAEMIRSLVTQMQGAEFWQSVGNSSLKIIGGFLLAFFCGALTAGVAFRFPLLKLLLEPVIQLAKSVPVASFVVLLLILAGSKNLSVFVVFLMVFPMIYVNMGQGLERVDSKMLEMSQVFGMSLWKKFLYIYRPAFFPFLASGSKVALGMSWKSGVAAEIIGVPSHSIGERFYMAKIYLDTESLFAWTLVVILLSLLFERGFLWLLKKFGGKAWKGEGQK